MLIIVNKAYRERLTPGNEGRYSELAVDYGNDKSDGSIRIFSPTVLHLKPLPRRSSFLRQPSL